MVKTLRILVLLCLITIACATNAQITIKIDEKINEQLRMKNASIDTTKIAGYRIQIAFSTDHNNVISSESEFKNWFPMFRNRVYTLYQQPYWKVRVGDYYREIDAQKMLKDVREHFPNAFLVKDNIRRPLVQEQIDE
ncbi:MAG: SPOR domain-containing protein [Bacteroidia bacterium]|tara:strand:- start:47349 stop:47759 length:411 start_codon:yes stop_codon:yes gene_type:complete